MSDETPMEDLRTFATFDSHGGKVSKRVEVLPLTAPQTDDGRYDGLVAVRGEAPLGVLDEHPDDVGVGDGTSMGRDAGTGIGVGAGTMSVGWVDPSALRDWYHPDRVVVPLLEARRAGLQEGLFADTRTRGRVRIAAREGHLGPDGRPAFRALVGPVGDPRLDAPLPLEDVVRIVAVSSNATTPSGAAGLAVVTTPVTPILAPGLYPDHGDDRAGLAPAPPHGTVRVRAFSVSRGERHEIERLDAQANTMWVVAPSGATVPIAVNGIGPDLVRYIAEPV